MSKGIGAYNRAGEVSGPAGVLSKTNTPHRHRARAKKAASSSRLGGTFGRRTNRWCAPSRIAGISTMAVTAFEIPRLRHSIQ